MPEYFGSRQFVLASAEQTNSAPQCMLGIYSQYGTGSPQNKYLLFIFYEIACAPKSTEMTNEATF